MPGEVFLQVDDPSISAATIGLGVTSSGDVVVDTELEEGDLEEEDFDRDDDENRAVNPRRFLFFFDDKWSPNGVGNGRSETVGLV